MNFISRWFEKRKQEKLQKNIYNSKKENIIQQFKEAGFVDVYHRHSTCEYCRDWAIDFDVEYQVVSPGGKVFNKKRNHGKLCIDCDYCFNFGNRKEYTIIQYLEEFASKPIDLRQMYLDRAANLEKRLGEVYRKLKSLPTLEGNPYR